MKLKSKILLGTLGAAALAAIPTTIALASTSCGSSSNEEAANNDPNVIYRPAANIKTKFTQPNLARLRNEFLTYYTVGLGDAEVLKREVKVSLIDYELTINLDIQWNRNPQKPTTKAEGASNSVKSIIVYMLTPMENGLYQYNANDFSEDPNTPVEDIRQMTLFQLKRDLDMWYNIEDRYKPNYQLPEYPEVQSQPAPSIASKVSYNDLSELYNGFLKQGLRDALGKKLTKPESSGTLSLNGTQLTCNITFSGLDASNNKQTFTNKYRFELAPNASGEYEYAYQQSPTDASETVTNLTLIKLKDNLQTFMNLSYADGLALN